MRSTRGYRKDCIPWLNARARPRSLPQSFSSFQEPFMRSLMLFQVDSESSTATLLPLPYIRTCRPKTTVEDNISQSSLTIVLLLCPPALAAHPLLSFPACSRPVWGGFRKD